MKKLTIEHIAPYLPYDLQMKVRNDNSDTIWTLGCENIKHAIQWWKPILRPMSDQNKVIKYNDGEYMMTDIINEHDGCDSMEYRTFISYVKKHFDVFGLIEAGLAIDVNTLPQ